MIRTLTLVAVLGCALTAHAGQVVTVAPWELHNSFWMSLHQRLIDGAMHPDKKESGLTAEEQEAWSAAVEAYRKAGGSGNMAFADAMIITTDALSQLADDATMPLIEAPLRDALLQAAPVYRRYWWTSDEEASRFFIGYAAAMLRDAGAELIRQHEAAYGVTWPNRVRVYVTPMADPFGAYTVSGRAGGWITTMSCRDAEYQGVHVLEMFLHESSHAVVGPRNGRVAKAIAAAATSHHVPMPPDLYHAIIFATSGELARRALAERGVTDYVPVSTDVFKRAWPGYRAAFETYWMPYLSGQGTLAEAIDGIVATIPR